MLHKRNTDAKFKLLNVLKLQQYVNQMPNSRLRKHHIIGYMQNLENKIRCNWTCINVMKHYLCAKSEDHMPLQMHTNMINLKLLNTVR